MAGGGTSTLAADSLPAAASGEGSFGASDEADDEAAVEDEEEADEEEAAEEDGGGDGGSEGFAFVSAGGVGGISGPPGDGVS